MCIPRVYRLVWLKTLRIQFISSETKHEPPPRKWGTGGRPVSSTLLSKQNGNIETHQHSPGRGTKSDRVQEVFEPYSQTQGLNFGWSCGGTGAGIDKILPTQDIPRF